MSTALQYARAELERGAGESGVDNGGPDIAAYHGRRFVPGRSYGHWCAAFVSWCLMQAGLLEVLVRGAKRLCRVAAARGAWVYRPRRLRAPLERMAPAAGDVAAWHRGLPGSWEGHVGFVEAYQADSDTLVTIEGNASRFPCRVERKTYPTGKWRRRLYGIARPRPSSGPRARATAPAVALVLALVAGGCLEFGDAIPQDAAIADAPLCVQHRFGAGDLDPPGARAESDGRIVASARGGLGVGDGYIDTGESLRVVFDSPVVLELYDVAWREDGPDANTLPGEHEYRMRAADGLQYRGWAGAYGDRKRLGTRRVISLEIVPVDGDRLALNLLAYCHEQ